MISMPNALHQASVSGAHWLVEMEFSVGTQRVTTAPVNVDSMGYTWQGLGVLSGVSDVSESANTGAEQIRLSLSIVSTAMLASVLGNVEGYRGRRVRMYLQLFDAAFQPQGDAVLRWSGYMEPVQVERSSPALGAGDEPSGQIVMPCSRAGMARARNRQGLRLTLAQQQRLYPADVGLQYVRSLIEKPALWLSKRFQQQ